MDASATVTKQAGRTPLLRKVLAGVPSVDTNLQSLDSMKTNTPGLLFGFILLALSSLAPLSQAQQTDPVRVVITPTQIQYRVLDLAHIAPGTNLSSAQTLEQILNELGAQGWKVVTTSGSFIILSRTV